MRIVFLVIIIFSFLTACKEKTAEDYAKKEIIAVNEELRDGNTVYVFAFADGTYERVGFGTYSTKKVGDTICFEKGILDAWRMIDCSRLEGKKVLDKSDIND